METAARRHAITRHSRPTPVAASVRVVAAVLVMLAVAGPAAAGDETVNTETPALIDDFSDPRGKAPSGASWRLFTDQVMGGISRADAMHVDEGERRFMRLMGMVSLDNNGGFIQVALPLGSRGQPLDASAFTGIRLEVRADGEGYAVHFRTSDCNRPWEHYKAEIPPGDGWRTVEIPFSSFGAYAIDQALDPSQLTRLGIVAGSREFVADISVGRVEFFAAAP